MLANALVFENRTLGRLGLMNSNEVAVPKRGRGRPPCPEPAPIADTAETIVAAVVRTRPKAERERIMRR